MRITYRKQRKAQSKDDFETWVESDTANTLNEFDSNSGGGIRATTIILSNENTNREEVL